MFEFPDAARVCGAQRVNPMRTLEPDSCRPVPGAGRSGPDRAGTPAHSRAGIVRRLAVGLHQSCGYAEPAGARGARRAGRRADSLVSVQDVSQPLHDRDRSLSGPSRDHLEQYRRSRLPGALHHVVGDSQGRTMVGRRAALGHGDSSGLAGILDVLAGIGGGHSRRAADRVAAVRRQGAERRTAEAGARLAGAAARPAAIFCHALLQRGRSRRPRLRTRFILRCSRRRIISTRRSDS